MRNLHQTYPILYRLLVVLLIINYCSIVKISAQEGAKMRGITPVEYAALKGYTFKDIANDTYIKLENGLVLDRFEMKPAYVFAFSDGMERKIFLFKVSDSKDKKELGLLASYKNSKTLKSYNITFPNVLADKIIWGKYIDDLKDFDKLEYGFSATVAFVLGKELAAATSGGGAVVAGKADDEYEFCFPQNAMVSLDSKKEIAISEVKKGDKILTYKGEQNKLKYCTVNKLIAHHGIFKISKLLLQPTESAYVSIYTYPTEYVELEATYNHPVYTTTGQKKMGDITVGEKVMYFDASSNSYKEYIVIKSVPNHRKVSTVYNLKTSSNCNYLVNKIVVLPK